MDFYFMLLTTIVVNIPLLVMWLLPPHDFHLLANRHKLTRASCFVTFHFYFLASVYGFIKKNSGKKITHHTPVEKVWISEFIWGVKLRPLPPLPPVLSLPPSVLSTGGMHFPIFNEKCWLGVTGHGLQNRIFNHLSDISALQCLYKKGIIQFTEKKVERRILRSLS